MSWYGCPEPVASGHPYQDMGLGHGTLVTRGQHRDHHRRVRCRCRGGVVAHATLVVRGHPGHLHQPASDHLRHRVGRYRSLTPGRSASGPGPTDVELPSGHVGASVALYTSLAVMATTIERTWLRRTVIGVCSVVPVP